MLWIQKRVYNKGLQKWATTLDRLLIQKGFSEEMTFEISKLKSLSNVQKNWTKHFWSEKTMWKNENKKDQKEQLKAKSDRKYR